MEYKCEVCRKEADFVSPANLCEYHWKLWWYSGMFDGIDPWDLPQNMSREEREFYLKIKRDGEFLEIEHNEHGKLVIFNSEKIYN